MSGSAQSHWVIRIAFQRWFLVACAWTAEFVSDRAWPSQNQPHNEYRWQAVLERERFLQRNQPCDVDRCNWHCRHSTERWNIHYVAMARSFWQDGRYSCQTQSGWWFERLLQYDWVAVHWLWCKLIHVSASCVECALCMSSTDGLMWILTTSDSFWWWSGRTASVLEVDRPAHVVQWSNHLGAMCSRAWRSQWPRIDSSLGPGASAY